MRKVLLYSSLLILGLVLSQLVPHLGAEPAAAIGRGVQWLSMTLLAFIMIHVGYEFEIDKARWREYGWDYVVAATAAAFPWIFVALYFIYVMMPPEAWASFAAWREILLAGRFAAPTSAGVLFAMLAAAGLAATWLFKKARVLAIFDDLDTVLLMIPLKIMMVGPRLQLGVVIIIMAVMLWAAWRWLHRLAIPIRWPAVLLYSIAIATACEGVHVVSLMIDDSVPVHVEVLLPAFVLGCMMKRPPGADPHADDALEGHEEGPESPGEQRASTIVSAGFMVLVGLSMPPILGNLVTAQGAAQTVTAAQESPGWWVLTLHVLAVTAISNLGKMFPALCYRREAHWRDRLALSIGMWPRGEVGAGVLMVSIGYGIGGPVLTVAVLSLALNLLLTGVFIYCVKKIAVHQEAEERSEALI